MNSTKQAHILIVDDDVLLRSMAARTLLHAGFQVSEAASGEEGLVRVSERCHDLILLDVMMGGLDGYEVCRRVRATPAGTVIPILMLTGLNDTASIELAFSQGATDFITKPINWTLLSHKVRYALRASAVAEAMRRGRESLARAQNLAGMGNWTVLPDGRLEASAELLRLFGLPVDAGDSVSVEALLEMIVADDRDAVRRAWTQLVEGGTPYQLTFRIHRPDGEVRTVFEQAGRSRLHRAILKSSKASRRISPSACRPRSASSSSLTMIPSPACPTGNSSPNSRVPRSSGRLAIVTVAR